MSVLLEVLSHIPIDPTGRESAILEHNWTGHGFAIEGSYDCFAEDIHKFVIDEEHGYMITKTTENSLQVHELAGMRCLWTLSNVCPFSFCSIIVPQSLISSIMAMRVGP